MPVVINEFETVGENTASANPAGQKQSSLSRQRTIEKQMRKLAMRNLRQRRN